MSTKTPIFATSGKCKLAALSGRLIYQSCLAPPAGLVGENWAHDCSILPGHLCDRLSVEMASRFLGSASTPIFESWCNRLAT